MMMTDYFLSHGSHKRAEDGRCAMEWVSYLAGEPHSDSPACVCPTLQAFCIAFNDGLPDDHRQRLRPYLARTIGTAGDGLAEHRSRLATDWLIRTYAPAWLELAGLTEAAGRLRSLPPVLMVENLSRAMVDLGAARNQAAAARAAARAARAAAGDAAWAAAWAAAGAAAWAAAGDAAGDAAWAAAGDAAWAAAGDAAGAAAWAAAGAALASTVDILRASAFDLLDRMLPTEAIQLPAVADAERMCGVPILGGA